MRTGDVAYQSGRDLPDSVVGPLLAQDKQAFPMILYPGSPSDAISIHPVDGYDKGVSFDGRITGGGTAIYGQRSSITTDPCSSGSIVGSFCPYGSQGTASL